MALSQTAGRMVLREANADVLPMYFTGFADTMAGYVTELKKLDADMKTKSEKEDKLLNGKAFTPRVGPDRDLCGAPVRRAGPPLIDFAPLDVAVAKLKASAKAYDDALASGAVPPARAARVNAILQDIDQSLLDERGLPGRPWYKNLAYAPGVLTGYGAKTLPGVREAIEGRRWAEAQTYVGRTARVLEDYAARVDAATAALKS